MAKKRVGFDIGAGSLKVAVTGGVRTVVHEIRLPEQMFQDGEIRTPNGFSEFLKRECKKRRIPKGECALVLPARQVLCRTVTLPKMTIDQLMLNLPYEFSDFIADDADKFFCDYAMCESTPEEEAQGQMTMMAATVAKERITQYVKMFSNAGFKLRTLLPAEMVMIRIADRYRQNTPGSPEEYCFVDLGQEKTTIMIIRKDRVRATRQIQEGCAMIDQAIADAMNVDPFLAGSYKHTNYQNVLESPECTDIYQRIAVEILKVVNFYQYNYRDSQLGGLYLIGGGSQIDAFRQVISSVLELPLLPVEELLGISGVESADARSALAAIGLTIG